MILFYFITTVLSRHGGINSSGAGRGYSHRRQHSGGSQKGLNT